MLTSAVLHLLLPSKVLASRSNCPTDEMVPTALPAALPLSVVMQEMRMYIHKHIAFFPWFLSKLVFIKYMSSALYSRFKSAASLGGLYLLHSGLIPHRVYSL